MVAPWKNLHFATLELVRATPIKQRLVAAYRRHLTAIPVDSLPDPAREPFGQLMRTLGSVPPLRGEDAVAASVRKMSVPEAEECAALLVEIYGLVSQSSLNSMVSQRVVS